MEIENEQSTVEARVIASNIASHLGFGKTDCAEIALAISEIAGNAVKHAEKGALSIRLSGNKKGIIFLVQDSGQGIKNLKNVMHEGYSSVKSSLGIGLNVAQRAMDEFVIRSKFGLGTKVTMKKFLPIPEDEIEYGVLSLNDERYIVNSDAYVIKEFDGDKVLLAVIDATGNDFSAREVANFVKAIISDNHKSDLITIVKKCHRELRKNFDTSQVRSCMLGILLLKSRSLEYVGIGNTSINIYGNSKKIKLLSSEGKVGDTILPELTLQKIRCDSRITIIMCSDGILPHYTEENLPLEHNAQHITNFIMNNYHLPFNDSTVLVAKRKR